MGSKKSTAPGAHTLRVEGDFTIYRAAELKPTLLQAVAAHPHLEIDLSGVKEFDSAGVQLLLLSKRAAHRQGHTLRLVGHSAVVVEAFQLLDLAAHFGDALVVAA